MAKVEPTQIPLDVQNELKLQLEEFKLTILDKISKSLTEEIGKVIWQFDSSDRCNGHSSKLSNLIRRDKYGNLPKKVFLKQNSVLTDMWATPHFHAFYNICTALLIFLIINSTLLYIFDSNLFAADKEFLLWSFGSVGHWGSMWLGMNFAVLAILYPLFRLWATNRAPCGKIGLFDYSFLGFYIAFLGGFILIPAYSLVVLDVPPVSTFFVLMEQIRLAMKSHAFVRHNIPKAIYFKPHQDADKHEVKLPCPEFQKLLYFLFAPTLMYRDEYPRTATIAWDSVAWYFLQVVITILVTFIAFRRFVVEIFASAGQELFTPEYFILVLSGSILMGTMSLFVGFYGLLHCWHNAFAEMLMFADRQFYQDWWNSTTFSNYYRTWNTIVHDWLYGYIYRDVFMAFGKRQVPGMIAVFAISAVVHEYIMGMTLGFCYPVLFLFFVLNAGGVIFKRNSSKGVKRSSSNKDNSKTIGLTNIFLWFALFLGWGLMIILYSMEWYSRRNCPQTQEMPWDYFVPRSWTCKVFHSPFTSS